jgi:hypothetical protein
MAQSGEVRGFGTETGGVSRLRRRKRNEKRLQQVDKFKVESGRVSSKSFKVDFELDLSTLNFAL